MVWKNDQVSELETQKIIELAKKALSREGDYVELGCYRGDTSLMLAEVLRDNKEGVENPVKKLWIYDSFEGLPRKESKDSSELGKDFQEGELFVSKREVKTRFLKAGLALPVIKKGWFSDLKFEDLPEKIAFAFLDGDFYSSIRDSLRLIEGKMVDQGVIIVHDYDNQALPGVRKAVDEWMVGKRVKMERFHSLAVFFVI